MRATRILLNGLALTVINLCSILAGFVLWYVLFRQGSQVAIQGTAAALLTIAVFPGWTYLLLGFRGGRFHLKERSDFLWAFVFALLWLPVIFVPLHFLRRGYLTSFSNIWMTWLLQVPTNALALLAARICPKFRKERCNV
jgi:hypothetical protein